MARACSSSSSCATPARGIPSPVVSALACAMLYAGSAWGGAQDAPREQRISSGALHEQVRRRPQGVTVPAEITKQGNKAVLQTADSTVELANPNAVAQQVRQMPVQAVIVDGPGDSVQLQDVQLQATKRWNDLGASKRWNDLPSAKRARYRNVDAAQRRLSNAAESALGADATDADLRRLKQTVDATEHQVVQAYKTLGAGQRVEQRELVEQHAELRRLNKSLYGFDHDDRYPPQAYERIYANSRGAFALRAKQEDKPRCSAVLIGEKLALTNNHCILEEMPDEFEAVFDYEDDLDGNHLDRKVFPVTAIRLSDEDERGQLDFVLLELGANAEGVLPGAAYPVQCLSLAPVRRDDPLYVVGYPLGEPRTTTASCTSRSA
jgi:Trypsin-like peptidase domain